MGIAEEGDVCPADSPLEKGDPILWGRRSLVLGMLTSGFVIANAAHPSAMTPGTFKPIAAAQPLCAPKWPTEPRSHRASPIRL